MAQKQKVRVEFSIEEHDYQVMNPEEDMFGDSYAFNGDCGISELEVYINDEQISDDALEKLEDNTRYTDYEKVKLNWEEEEDEVAFFGYICGEQRHEYEFETEDFDVNKLVFLYRCYDVCFEDADYSAEEHCVSVLYDGVELENLVDSCGGGNWEQIWSRYDDEDEEDYEDDEDNDN